MSTGSPSLYLLIGKERLLKDEFIEALRARLFPEGDDAGLNAQEFHGEKNSTSDIFDFLNTTPFAAERRLGVVWGVDLFGEEERERVLAGFDKCLPSAVLVLESEQTNAKKDAFLRKLSEKAALTACHTPFDRDLPGWTELRARKHGLALERRAALFLISCSGGSLSVLASMIEQLAVFVHPRTNAALADAEKLFQKRSEDDVFQLADLLLEGKQGEALRVLDALFQEGARGPEIIAALGTQMERWKKGAVRLAQGAKPDEIGLELKIPVFFQGPFFARLKRLPRARLRSLTETLLECDESYKSGRTTERLALEKFIWRC